jgi:hypothetical protein
MACGLGWIFSRVILLVSCVGDKQLATSKEQHSPLTTHCSTIHYSLQYHSPHTTHPIAHAVKTYSCLCTTCFSSPLM